MVNQSLFKGSWEDRLESKIFADNPNRTHAYICSSFDADTQEEALRNMRSARAFMHYATELMGVVARAPHAYLPMLLNERDTAERILALKIGHHLIEKSDLVLVCGNRISVGMQADILHAAALQIPVWTFKDTMYHSVLAIVSKCDDKEKLVKLVPEHFVLNM